MAAVNPLLSIIVTVAADWSQTSRSNQRSGITPCANAPVATLKPQNTDSSFGAESVRVPLLLWLMEISGQNLF